MPTGDSTRMRAAFFVAVAVALLAGLAPSVINILDDDAPVLVLLLLLAVALVALGAAVIIGRKLKRPKADHPPQD
jgi:hypothetical protein